ncbi:NAD(P)-dependent dehydrogenase (short-subunit alcohol dehydrogenase family) [Bacillus fengqiuensis]|nr:NAD(P)-dependent dehydrogenase (short-subunit alcohol dehydrogenase family) [Bacillus fengqiuensis]
MKKKVLITGAGRGLGYELTKVFFIKEHVLFPVVRTKQARDHLIHKFPKHCYPIMADLQTDDCKQEILAGLNKYTDSLDVVINNAGIPGTETNFDRVTSEEVINLFNIHCLGILRTVQTTLPFLEKSHSPLVLNISSRIGSVSRMASGEFKERKEFSYSYRIAKAAQNMLSVCMYNELADKGIRIFAMHPGEILTNMASSDADRSPENAASEIYHWIEKKETNKSIGFIEPSGKVIPW